jgi:CoA:oxalate CoA-transferase
MQASAAETRTEVTELSAKPRPLDGLRVIDLSRFIAGPFAARLLSDLGADVVKIEPPEGDVTRLFGVVRQGLSGLYVQQNAGKRNLCVDLKTAGAAELVLNLVRKADVVIENFRSGVMERLGLSWSKLSEANPRIILLSISGFGQTGPEAHRQAYAPIIHAESGWVGRRGEMLGEPPRDSVMSFADSITGLHGLIALLAAIQLRGRTGRGQHLDIAMLDSWLATDDYIHYLLDGASAPVFQGGEVFETPGGPLMLNRTLPHVWKLLKRTYGLMSEEPTDADQETKIRCRREAVVGWMASFAERENLKRALEKADLAWGEVRTSANLLDSPTIAARGVAASVEDGHGGARLVIQSPYRFSDAECGVRGRAAYLGEHNTEVLKEWLDSSEADLQRLTDGGILSSGSDGVQGSA